MSRLDISSVRQIPLDADDDVFETWKMDGCRDVIRDAPFEQNVAFVASCGSAANAAIRTGASSYPSE